MQRVLRHSFRAALLAFLALIAVGISPIGGVANAASSSTTCSPGESGLDCNLEILAPESVVAGHPFTVQVAIMNGGDPSTVVKSDVCVSKVEVTLTVEYGYSYVVDDTNTYYSYSRSYYAKPSAGIATFTIQGFPDVSFYTGHQLWAHVDVGDGLYCGGNDYYFSGNPALIEVTSLDSENEPQPKAPCPLDLEPPQCVQPESGSGTAATLYAETGSFYAEFVPFIYAQGCGDTGPLDPNGVLYFTYDGEGNPSPKTIIFALSPFLITKGIGQYQVCWNSLNAFTPLGGGDPINIGYLPDCKKGDPGPCVVSRTSDQYNAGYFEVRAPEEDPKGYVW